VFNFFFSCLLSPFFSVHYFVGFMDGDLAVAME
jgi:uncharacterized Rossmann fold enzyme